MKGLSKDINDLFLCVDWHEMYNIVLDFVTNKMAVHFDVFSPLMENQVVRDVDGNSIVKKYRYGLVVRNSKIYQQVKKPLRFVRSIYYNFVFDFKERPRDDFFYFSNSKGRILSKNKSLL